MQLVFVIQKVKLLSLQILKRNKNEYFFCLFITGFIHKLQRAVYLETDTPEILDEAITVVRKGGTIAIIGD
jgi:hypothetical protein